MESGGVAKEEFSDVAITLSEGPSCIKETTVKTLSDRLLKSPVTDAVNNSDKVNSIYSISVSEKLNGSVGDKEPAEESSDSDKLKKDLSSSSDDLSVSSDMSSSSSSDEENSSNLNKLSNSLAFNDTESRLEAVNDLNENSGDEDRIQKSSACTSSSVFSDEMKSSRLSDDSSSSSDSFSINCSNSVNETLFSKSSNPENNSGNINKLTISNCTEPTSFDKSISHFTLSPRNSLKSENPNCPDSSNVHCNDRIYIECSSKNINPCPSIKKDIVNNVLKRKLSLSSESSDSENNDDLISNKLVSNSNNFSEEISKLKHSTSSKFSSSCFSPIKSSDKEINKVESNDKEINKVVESTCNEISFELTSRSFEKSSILLKEQIDKESNKCERLPEVHDLSYEESRTKIEFNEMAVATDEHVDTSTNSTEKYADIFNTSMKIPETKPVSNSISTETPLLNNSPTDIQKSPNFVNFEEDSRSCERNSSIQKLEIMSTSEKFSPLNVTEESNDSKPCESFSKKINFPSEFNLDGSDQLKTDPELNSLDLNKLETPKESNVSDSMQLKSTEDKTNLVSKETSFSDSDAEFKTNYKSPIRPTDQMTESIDNFKIMSPSALSESSLLSDDDSTTEIPAKISDENLEFVNSENGFVKSTLEVLDVIGSNGSLSPKRLHQNIKTMYQEEEKLSPKSQQSPPERDDLTEINNVPNSFSSEENSKSSGHLKLEQDSCSASSNFGSENNSTCDEFSETKKGTKSLETNHLGSPKSPVVNLDGLFPKSNCITPIISSSLEPKRIDEETEECLPENKSKCTNLLSILNKKSDDALGIKKSFKNKRIPLKSKKGSIKFKKKFLLVNSKKKNNSNVLKSALGNKFDKPVEPQLTEYAQYLGLQPTLKFKCCICAQIGFQSYSELREHQKHCTSTEVSKTCASNVNDLPGIGKSVVTPVACPDDLNQTNFRITRKVYLCSACGTYYENWNLFLHMREVHKRYICLLCLSMFTMSYKLADHLVMTHDIQVESFESISDFKKAFNCSYFISCTDCGKLFSELDNWCAHQCQFVCNICNIKNGHLPRCSRSSFVKADEVNQTGDNLSQSIKPAVKIFPSSTTSTMISNHPEEKNYDFASNFCCVNISETDQNVSKSEVTNAIVKTSTSNTMKISIVRKEEKINLVANSERKKDSVKKAFSEPTLQQESEGEWENPLNIPKSVKEEPEKVDCNVRKTEGTEEVARTVKTDKKESESITYPSSGDYKEIPLCKKIDQNSVNELEPCDSLTDKQSDQISDIKSSEVNLDPLNSVNLSKATDMKCINNSIIKDLEKPILESNQNFDKQSKLEDSTLDLNSKAIKELDQNEENELKASVFDLDDSLLSEPTQKEDSDETISRQLENNDEICELDSRSNQISGLSNKVELVRNDDDKPSADVESDSDGSDSEPKTTGKSNPRLIFESKQILSEDSKMELESDAESSNAFDQNKGDAPKHVLKISLKKTFKSNTDENSLNISSNDSSDSDSNRLSMVIDNSVNGDDKENDSDDGKNSKRSDEKEAAENMVIDYKSDNAVDNLVEHNDANSYLMESEEKASYKAQNNQPTVSADGIVLASEDVPPLTLTLNGALDSINLNTIVKECVRTSCTVCVYCNHALKIAVNGKQLILHLLAEHRFTPMKSEDSFEKLVRILKNGLNELETVFFNTDSYDSSDKTSNLSYDGTFSCFQCPFWTLQHKDLYTHKRKMHQKTILLCVMCKSNFYSYSELLCHMCPGTYQPNDIFFRCCFCHIDKIPSAFRLMVHIRKIHHTCEICLDVSNDQQKLATHMWKHKLHHLCYRCGIAYRNKPDITRHLFWKHGTESVLCKKCLQKKWPHVYHFCIPPSSFVCDECNSTFSRTVALRVHKRLHTNEKPHACSQCEEKFISKKILAKHEISHSVQPPEVGLLEENAERKEKELITTSLNKRLELADVPVQIQKTDEKQNIEIVDEAAPTVRVKKSKTKKQKPILDLTDLPPLNLSSESDSDVDAKIETVKLDVKKLEPNPTCSEVKLEIETTLPESAGADEMETNQSICEQTKEEPSEKKEFFKEFSDSERLEIVLADHDYCLAIENKENSNLEDKTDKGGVDINSSTSLNNSVCSPMDIKETSTSDSSPTKQKLKSPKKKLNKSSISSSSSSSSDSDSSSCFCGPNCSCSSSSSDSSTSTSSDSDSSSPENRRKQEERRQKRRERTKTKSPKPEIIEPVNAEPSVSVEPEEPVILESDLDTDVTLTDEDFYDEYPQQHANKVLAEKRDQLMLLASVAPTHTAPSSPVASAEDTPATPAPSSPKVKKKVRMKRKRLENQPSSTSRSVQMSCDSSSAQLPPISTPSLITKLPNPNARNFTLIAAASSSEHQEHFSDRTQSTGGSGSESESKRFSKRRRVKNKFYGYSSDEENQVDENKPRFRLKKVKKVVMTPKFEPVQPMNISSIQSSQTLPVYQPSSITIKPLAAPTPSVSDISKRLAATYHRPPSPSSSSSDSDDDKLNIDEKFSEPPKPQSQPHLQPPTQPVPAVGLQQTTEKNASLYCYCQCPYDEVSEMIACDGDNCAIEWFHFECVGIMVPPKGQWFCPDCRKKKDFSY